MMPNHPTHEDLFAYRDGELDHEKRGLVEAHVLSCTACAARLEAVSDAEGFLRPMHAEPPGGYLEDMTESVMARVTSSVAARGGVAKASPGASAAGAGAGAGSAASRGGGRAPAESRERPGRRRQFDDVERGRAPRLPWPAIISAVSAAAAVVVVVVLLFRSQGTSSRLAGVRSNEPTLDAKEKRADEASKQVASAPEREPGAADGAAMNDKDVGSAAGQAPDANAPAPSSAVHGLAAKSEDLRLNRQETSGNLQATPPAERDEAAITSQNANDVMPQAALEKRDQAAPSVDRFNAARAKALAETPSAAVAAPSGSEFAPLVARYGLPPLYDPSRVSNETLLRLEPDLRMLYQAGRAGDDSARVRLYLAEAARLRAGDSPNEETYDAIVHHYRRAFQLARDPETRKMALKRLDDFVSRVAPTTP